MAHYPPARREFLKLSACAAAAFRPSWPAARSTGRRGIGRCAGLRSAGASFEIEVTEVEVRRNRAGRMLMARVYRPKGPGPFPALLDLHGGAWNNKDRKAEEPMDRALAASGVLVVAIDLTLAPEAPYPASVQDANYGVRWLKWKAAGWNGDASRLGIYGSSSGGHVAQLLAMRPHDPRYNAIPLRRARHRSTPPSPTWRCARRSAIPSPAIRTR